MSRTQATQATMEDVARAAGVSRALVSLVMRDSPKVSPKSREKVMAAAARLKYRPNAIARQLASRRTRTIGVLLNELHNPFYAEIMDGVDTLAAELDYRIVIGTAGRRARGEEATVDAFLEMRTDGLILVGPRLPAGGIAAAAAVVPVVVVARPVRSPRVDTIVNDERAGALLVVRHLAELGHRHILHIDGGRGAGAWARRSGYEYAMQRFGFERDIRVLAGDYTDAAGARAASRLLADGDLPTAIFAANDLVAAGAIERLEDGGLTIPEDVSLVGYDNTFLAGLHHVSLTTVNQPCAEMGRLAMQGLVDRIDGGRTTAVNHRLLPELVVRRTTGRPRAA